MPTNITAQLQQSKHLAQGRVPTGLTLPQTRKPLTSAKAAPHLKTAYELRNLGLAG